MKVCQMSTLLTVGKTVTDGGGGDLCRRHSELRSCVTNGYFEFNQNNNKPNFNLKGKCHEEKKKEMNLLICSPEEPNSRGNLHYFAYFIF